MSAKVSRKTTAQSSASSSTMYSTPQEPTSSQNRSRSPLSPTRVSRMAEKHELQSLNDRLAVYMDTVRSLEKENSRLVKQVEISQETINKEKTQYRAMYEQELSDARRMLDDIASSRARLEIDNKRLREENEDLKSGLDKATKECRKLEANLNVLEHRFADLQTKYNKAANDLKSRDEDLRDLDRVKQVLAEQRHQVESETLARVDLENKLQSLKEEASFKQSVYEQEVTQLRTKRHHEISEIDGRLTVEYEDKLQAALKELRDSYEAQLQDNRDEIINLYENKIRRLEEHSQKNMSGTQAAVEELRAVQVRFDLASSQLASVESANANLQARVRELERQLEMERTRSVEQLASREQELAVMRSEMNAQLKDYQDLMEIKVALDSELNAYRKLLEFEEQRLNIVPNVTSPIAAIRRGTPTRRGTPLLGKASKRRRIMLDESEATDTFQVTGEAHTDIEISDVDPEGKFVELHNKSDKEQVIGGWTIKHTVGDSGQETSFKLHRSVKIEGGGKVTVWAADAGRTHEPPHNIVMKQKWFSGDPATTVLSNSDGEEVARRQRQRVVSSSYRREYDDDADPQADLNRQECTIM